MDKKEITSDIAQGVAELIRGSWRVELNTLLGRTGDYMAAFRLHGTQLTLGLHPQHHYITVHANSLPNIKLALQEISALIQALKNERPEWLHMVKIKSFLLANQRRRMVLANLLARNESSYSESVMSTPPLVQTLAFLDLNARSIIGLSGNQMMSWQDLAEVGEVVIDL